MDAMTKKLKSLEKETASWKQRWEKSNTTLLDMAAEKKQRDGDLLSATKQVAQLEKLCRALQAERTSLIRQIKENAGAEELSAGSVSLEDATQQVSKSSNDSSHSVKKEEAVLTETEATTSQEAPSSTQDQSPSDSVADPTILHVSHNDSPTSENHNDAPPPAAADSQDAAINVTPLN